MNGISLRLTFAALSVAVLASFGCGDDESTATPVASTPAATASPAPQPTAVPPDDERVQEIIAQPGLVGFLSDLEDAIEANDVQFLLDNTRFTEYECEFRSGFPAEPEECQGNPGLKLSAIGYGIWQSEGGYWSEATYEMEISDRLTGDDAGGAKMCAIGQMTLGDEQSPDVADVVITGLGGLRELDPVEGHAMSLAIAEDDEGWVITEFDSALTAFVPDFYEWWIGWEEFAGAFDS